MIKSTLRFLIILITASILLIMYAFCMNLVSDYTSRTYTIALYIAASIIGNGLFGVYLWFVCRNTLKTNMIKFPIEYLLSAILVLFLMLSWLLNIFIFDISILLFQYCFPQGIIFVVVHFCLFIYIIKNRKKEISAE